MRYLSSCLALLALVALPLTGCDSTDDDLVVERLAGSWTLAELFVDGDPLTDLVFARYDTVVLTFFEDRRRFVLVGDVSDTADDLRLEGTFRVDVDDSEIVLLAGDLTPVVFDYRFSSETRLTLSDDDTSDLIETVFDLDLLTLDELIMIVERGS